MKMIRIVQCISFLILMIACQEKENTEMHIFYLHGRIKELQGVNAVSDKFGKYEYGKIISTLKELGGVMHNEVRTAETDFQEFCVNTSNEIDQLVKRGVKPSNISVIGASKGAIMSMNISAMNTHPINYILLAANNEYIENENQWNLNGRILGIYEKSDTLGGKNYDHWIEKSTNALQFDQIEINTGLGHGFLYKPMKEWIEPVKHWIKNDK